MNIIPFNQLLNSDLNLDAIYEGGDAGNVGDDPISKIFAVGNQGGFRIAGNEDNIKYLILYTSGNDFEWPDNINTETGIFKYYGDNKKPGNELHSTKKRGNIILKKLFDSLHSRFEPRLYIPPIFIFEKFATKSSSRSVRFRGLCVPGSIYHKSNEDLIAVWKTTNSMRFQNYAAFFTILDVCQISREWINDLNSGNKFTCNTPLEYLNFIKKGKYKPLLSEKSVAIRLIHEQIPKEIHQVSILNTIFNYFSKDSRLFEFFAADVFMMSNSNLIIDEITRGVKDGGRDAIGRLKIGLNVDPVYLDFSLEAKCYNPGINNGKINTVGVRETSRLISRIRNRQFGVLITTSAIAPDAYSEVRKDGHPIIFISGLDIVKILIELDLNTVEKVNFYLLNNFPKKVS
jgi:hypothetical protein